uniref:Transcription elongation regulator 1 like n=1 Tax=Sinocyclocheilus rhinocerous TaxID=307959 RepID=A0A673GDV3_9TELE
MIKPSIFVAGARIHVRYLSIYLFRVKAQPQLWHVSAEAPPWLWMVPNTSGLCRVGSVPPVLISSRPPPVIQTVSGWQMSCDPFVPVMRAAAAEPATISQFSLPSVGGHTPHVLGFQPSASVDLLPVFPHVYRTVLSSAAIKINISERISLKNSQQKIRLGIILQSTVMHFFYQSLFLFSGCPVAIKRVGSSKRFALAAAAMMAMDSDVAQGPSVSSAQPLHLLSLSPIKIPFLTAPHAGRSTKENAFISVPVLMKKIPISMDEDSSLQDKRPVASTPIPGSPWCVVWTGDDRGFFFNPTMHLSVWEKPVDLKDRGDLNRIIEDPPHKRKKDSLGKILCEEKNGSSLRMVLPLELRIGHFRDMLLERGVSAFSTWEKELHKIVFDPRYLLLSPEERKQIYDQFVKARMNEEHKEKKCKLQQAKEEYRKLLEESKITSRSTFKEFSEKYGKDPRFKEVLKRKDQELFFTQFISTLKKRDKENRIRLRKMR